MALLSSLRHNLVSFQRGLNAQTCRRLAGAALIIQILGALVASSTHLMLYGDGAYFVYSLSVGEPWLLKWATIPARATVYTITVIPTEWIGRWLDLSPLRIADLNGFIFYFVPALQFAAACTLVWRHNPQFLIFPTAQYILSTSLGFGFPSEILLAPGFLWICLFLILGNNIPSMLFLVSLLGLVFSHELAIPSALIVVWLALQQTWGNDDERREHRLYALVAIASVAIFISYVWVLFIGSLPFFPYAIYIIDPRRLVANPTLWLMMCSITVAIVYFVRLESWGFGRLTWGAAIIAAAATPSLLEFVVPAFDFDQGRYASSRTIVGGTFLRQFLCSPGRELRNR
jgi:hypothetical protein